jgi:hypothetical protein
MAGDPLRLDDTISYMASEVRPAVERQPGSLGTSLFIDPAAGGMEFESFWASHGSLVQSEEAIPAMLPWIKQRDLCGAGSASADS